MKHERGFGFLHVILILVVAVVSLGVWKHQAKKEAMIAAEQQRVAKAAAAAEKERQERIAAEKEALAKRLEDEKRKDDLDKVSASLKALHSRWVDAERLAQSTARIALAQPVATLQEIKREADGIIVPPCLDEAKTNLINGMNSTIEGFIQFMTDKKFAEITTPPFFSSAKRSFAKYETSKDACR